MLKRAVLAAVLLTLPVGGAWAQKPQTVRVAGAVESFDGHVLAVKSEKRGGVKISIAGDFSVIGIAKGSITDVKPGAYIGVGAMPQADGSQRAIQVTVMAESQRGLSEGHRPWNARPNSTMTNGSVDQAVESVDGPTVIVKYKSGEQKIVIPPDALIRAYMVGDKSDIKPGAHITIVRAMKKPDGSLEADRINGGAATWCRNSGSDGLNLRQAAHGRAA